MDVVQVLKSSFVQRSGNEPFEPHRGGGSAEMKRSERHVEREPLRERSLGFVLHHAAVARRCRVGLAEAAPELQRSLPHTLPLPVEPIWLARLPQ
jgi:hypothetical protein